MGRFPAPPYINTAHLRSSAAVAAWRIPVEPLLQEPLSTVSVLAMEPAERVVPPVAQEPAPAVEHTASVHRTPVVAAARRIPVEPLDAAVHCQLLPQYPRNQSCSS